FAEFNASKASSGGTALPQKLLLLGHKTTQGTATENEAVLVANGTQTQLFGQKAMLTAMLDATFAINPYQEIYALPLTEPDAGVQATWQIDFTGCNVASPKTIMLYLYGNRVSIGIDGNAATIANQVKDALLADPALPIDATVTVTGNICQFSFIHKGAGFNQEPPHFNRAAHEQDPEGFTYEIKRSADGAGAVDSITLAASLGDTWWSEIINPFSRDITLVNALDTVLTTRNGGTIQKPGMQYLARKDMYTTLVTFAQSRNSRFETILGLRESATPEYVIAAIYAAHIAKATATDPARALQYITLQGLMPAKDKQGFTDSERNILIGKGMSTLTQNAGGKVRLERAITSYKTNDAGAIDNSYTDLETFYILNLLRFQMNNRLLSRYPQVKVGNDSDMLRQGVVRPKDVKAEILALAQEWVNAGLINSIDEFRQHIVVNRSQNDPGRLEIILQPELIGQLRQIFVSIQFLR
ncbi:MAG: phage tail sheath subtilisin-like domain-containing protein, partial [Alphaproteobacteria bacterium]|nr:phage tail sheath subtilisin-like domain-containing protein [Alphaproteobacteria bacterium]